MSSQSFAPPAQGPAPQSQPDQAPSASTGDPALDTQDQGGGGNAMVASGMPASGGAPAGAAGSGGIPDDAAAAETTIAIACDILDDNPGAVAGAPPNRADALNELCMVVGPPRLTGTSGMKLLDKAVATLGEPWTVMDDPTVGRDFLTKTTDWRVSFAIDIAEETARAEELQHLTATLEPIAAQAKDYSKKLFEIGGNPVLSFTLDMLCRAMGPIEVPEEGDSAKKVSISGPEGIAEFMDIANTTVAVLKAVGEGKEDLEKIEKGHEKDDPKAQLEAAIAIGKAFTEGLIGTARALMKGTAYALNAKGGAKETVQMLTEGAEALEGGAGLLTGVMSILHAGLVLATTDDPNERMDAKVEGVTGVASMIAAGASLELGGEAVAAMAGVATAFAVAVPASWWTFKAAMEQMTRTEVDIAEAVCAPIYPELDVLVMKLTDTCRDVVAATALAAQATDDEHKAAYLQAANAKTGEVGPPIRDSLARLNNVPSKVIKPPLVEAMTAVDRSIGDVDACGKAIQDLQEALQYAMDNAGSLAAQEAGFTKQEADRAFRKVEEDGEE